MASIGIGQVQAQLAVARERNRANSQARGDAAAKMIVDGISNGMAVDRAERETVIHEDQNQRSAKNFEVKTAQRLAESTLNNQLEAHEQARTQKVADFKSAVEAANAEQANRVAQRDEMRAKMSAQATIFGDQFVEEHVNNIFPDLNISVDGGQLTVTEVDTPGAGYTARTAAGIPPLQETLPDGRVVDIVQGIHGGSDPGLSHTLAPATPFQFDRQAAAQENFERTNKAGLHPELNARDESLAAIDVQIAATAALRNKQAVALANATMEQERLGFVNELNAAKAKKEAAATRKLDAEALKIGRQNQPRVPGTTRTAGAKRAVGKIRAGDPGGILEKNIGGFIKSQQAISSQAAKHDKDFAQISAAASLTRSGEKNPVKIKQHRAMFLAGYDALGNFNPVARNKMMALKMLGMDAAGLASHERAVYAHRVEEAEFSPDFNATKIANDLHREIQDGLQSYANQTHADFMKDKPSGVRPPAIFMVPGGVPHAIEEDRKEGVVGPNDAAVTAVVESNKPLTSEDFKSGVAGMRTAYASAMSNATEEEQRRMAAAAQALGNKFYALGAAKTAGDMTDEEYQRNQAAVYSEMLMATKAWAEHGMKEVTSERPE